ncbi:Glycosyltransferase family 25 [Caballeronia sp. SBC1]|uniref:glycosyltransferase family 25 protein n=1 Tax=Caballeronia sp. SBC1 TaxID=2705548 RepID=UPI00140D9A62|nr:glycosyltransferase family 25 protein [Caballeronia sp. SBC1]QIN60052.1 Glycosyltransferase family 25 [Caballeronia sp. SBC1]
MFNVHVISLKRSVRRESIAKVLSDQNVSFTFEDAFDARVMSDSEFGMLYDDDSARKRHGRSLSRAEVACFISHREVWKKIAESGHGAVVLEDDALLEPAFFERLLLASDKQLASIADVVLLGRSKLRRASAGRTYLYEPLKRVDLIDGMRIGIPFKQWTSGSVGYWISAYGARLALGHTNGPVKALLDDWPWHRDHGGMCVKQLRPYAVWEAFETMESSIEAHRRALTPSLRAGWHEVVLKPLRVCRTGARWMVIFVLNVTARRSTSHVRAAKHE